VHGTVNIDISVGTGLGAVMGLTLKDDYVKINAETPLERSP